MSLRPASSGPTGSRPGPRRRDRPPARLAVVATALLLAALLVIAATPAAQIGGTPDSGGPFRDRPPSEPFRAPRHEAPCPNQHPEWRPEQTHYNVTVLESKQCRPDNPRLVAASVTGTNNVPQEDLDEMALHEDAVVKCCDRDGDGDPDVINVTLEVNEINGWHLSDDVLTDPFEIAPGIAPAFWVFSPKSTIDHSGEAFQDLVRMPSVPMRFEVGDTVRITLENTHYFPHTIHLHGFDHPFLDGEGEGNDGVPIISEDPVKPGEERTYEFTPRVPGTQFYHCHVHPHVHVNMGLATIAIIEEDRANNSLQTFNVGGGEVRHPSQASRERVDREYDLVYQAIDKELNEIPQMSNDPRWIAEQTNRVWDITNADLDYFLLNGRSFPYTLRESVITAAPNEELLLRIIDAGTTPISLHTHGHKGTIVANDGVPVPEGARVQRDVYTLTAAQRLDVVINTTDDGLNNYGPGVWFTHDHQEEAVTTDGIGPGGDITVIAYESFLDANTSFPVMQGKGLELLFTEEWWRGEIPVWAGLELPSFLGQIAEQNPSNGGDPGDPDDGRDDGDGPAFPIPGPDAGLVALAVLMAAGVARRWARWTGRRRGDAGVGADADADADPDADAAVPREVE